MSIIESLRASVKNLAELNLPANFTEILKHPIAILTVIGLLIIVLVLVRAKRVNFTPRLMVQIAIVLAISVVLDFFKIYRMPQGGDVTFGSMVPIILISLWYGPEVGFLTGMLFGILSLILGPYIVHPIQVLFDYPLPFLLLGTAGYFRNNKYLGTVAAVFLRFVCHVISGVVFFGSYAPPGQSPLVYSIIYNASYLSIDLVICMLILALLPVERLYKSFANA